MKFALNKKNIVYIILITIFFLSMYIRLFGYYEHNWPYLRNIDSYMYFRQMDYIVQTGSLPESDMLMNAPVGKEIIGGPQLYPYFGAYSYMFASSIIPMSLQDWLVWLPAILASLMVFPMYYIGKKLYNKKAGLFAALFVTFSVSTISRSLGGDPDTDSLVILMPLVSMAGYILLYKNRNKKLLTKKNVLLSAIAGLAMALFAHSWVGFWYVFWIILGFVIVKTIIQYGFHKKISKGLISTALMFLIFFFMFTVPFFGFNFISKTLMQPFGNIELFSPGGGLKGENWEHPNVMVSVQELMSGGEIKDLIQRTGNINLSGNPLVLISPLLLTLFCFIYLGYSYYKKKEHLDTLILLGIWFFGAIYTSIFAVRFTIFLIPSISITSAILFSKLWDMILNKESVAE